MASKATRSTYTPEKENAVFATRLRNLFKENSKTHTDLADYITKEAGESVTRQAVGQWCNGTTCPNIKTVPIIAKYFKVSTDYLFGLTEFEESDIEQATIAKSVHLSPDALKLMEMHFSLRAGNNEQDIKELSSVFEKIVSSHAFWDIVQSCWDLEYYSKIIFENDNEIDVSQMFHLADKLNVDERDLSEFINKRTRRANKYETELNAKNDMKRYENFKDIERISDMFDFREHISECSIDELCEILDIDESTLNDLRTKKAGD